MSKDLSLRQQLADLLTRGNAHATFADTVKGFPVERAGERPGGFKHSAWELLEHLRIAQNDILRFSKGKGYVELRWPDDYWPSSPAPRDAAEWDKSVATVRRELTAFVRLVNDPAQDLYKAFAWGDGQTLLREALVLADHNAYHVGQLMLVRRMLEG